jgi:hypothetical protein
MKEKLTCIKCSKNWKRERVRGRKPLLCPNCTVSSEQLLKPSEQPSTRRMIRVATPKEKKQKELIQGPSKWQCSSCLVSVVTEIGIYDPPVHACKKRLKKIFALEKVDKIIKAN